MPDPLKQKPQHPTGRLAARRASMDRIPVEGGDVYTHAIDRASHLIDLHDQVAVSFSGGKDSTATLHVALEAMKRDHPSRLPLRVVFYDEEAIPYQTEEYVRRVSQWPDITLEWYCVPVESTNACSRTSPLWYPWAPEDEPLWVRPRPPEGIDLPGFPVDPPEHRLAHYDTNGILFDPAKGSAVLLMGIRAQESLTRLRAVTRKTDENYLVKYSGHGDQGHVFKGYPVYDWTTEDVWTAPARFDWDYNRAYDVMAMAGLQPHSQRCSPAFGNEPLQKLHTYASCFPEIWDRMTTRVPGAAAAARYALTELYAYQTRPQKPSDMRWAQFIGSYLDRHEPITRRRTAEQIQLWIRTHYKKTADPLVVDAPHPLSGVSWAWLLMLAMRGDPKDRKQPGGRINTAKMDEHWTRYRTELATYADDDRLDDLNP